MGLELSSCPAGITFKRTKVPLGPLILDTVFSILQPITSTNSPSLPCATATMRSFTLSVLALNAGPPAKISFTFTTSLSSCNLAPIPS